jgi:hypothetical protein
MTIPRTDTNVFPQYKIFKHYKQELNMSGFIREQKLMIFLLTVLFLILNSSVQAQNDIDQKESINTKYVELSDSTKDLTVEKQAEELGTDKVEQKLHDREVIKRSKETDDWPQYQDRAGKTIPEKREVHSDGPRADGNEENPSGTEAPGE